MECWTHAGVDASGVCVHCGKAGCRHCLTMAAGVLVCRSCATQFQKEPSEESAKPGPADPRTRMIAAVVVGLAFAVMGLATLISMASGPSKITTPPVGMVFVVLLYAWMGWSVAWTLPPILKWVHVKIVRPVVASVRMAQPGCLLTVLFALFTLALLWYLLIGPVFAVALVYGVFGGGVREMLRCRRGWLNL